MDLLDKIRKGMELKQNSPSSNTLKKTSEKISLLQKELDATPENFRLLLDLYECYVEISDTAKKIECLEKMSKIKPNDSYPLQQLADIYSNELDEIEKAKTYQTKANQINKFS